jgi:hypothetical protein
MASQIMYGMVTISDYERLLEHAKIRLAEAEADVEALERVRRMAKKAGVEKNGDVPTADADQTVRAGRGDLIKAIRAFIASTPATFTMLDIYAAIDDAGQIDPKKQSIKATLGILERKGEVETVTRGIGRKPSVYRRKEKGR